jgi:hypothetical protein
MKFQQIRNTKGQEIKVDGVNAVVYLDGLVARAYEGKRNKPSFNYIFRSEDQAKAYIADWLEKAQKYQQAKDAQVAELKAKRAAWVPAMKAGDILYGSWGYDQTNVEFVEVIEVKGKRALVREVCHDIASANGYGGMAADVVPLPGVYMDGKSFEAVWKPILMNGYGESIKWHDYCHLIKWDGRPKYKSWYA